MIIIWGFLLSSQNQNQSETTYPFDEWNQTQHEYPKHKTICHLFEAQVQKSPEALAVFYEEKTLNYSDLNRKANQLAHFLISKSVGPESIIAVACDRSPEMIVAIMGILKAGAAFVPIDPSAPKDRLEMILQDVQAPFLLTQSWQGDRLAGMPTMLIELDRLDLDGIPSENPPLQSKPHHLAYVIYTSGSTGRPKGVMIEHGNLMNFICWFKDVFPATEKKGSLLHSPIIFDMPIPTLFQPLITGNYLHIIPQEFDPLSIVEAFKRGKTYSFIKLTPSHLRLIEAQYDISQLEQITDALIVAGEELKYVHLANWIPQTKNLKVYNEYGPTETTVGCSLYPISLQDQYRPKIPIGKPVWNTSFYILDEMQNPVPIGDLGELYVGGDGVARGYVNREDLTAEKFIPNPFMTEEDRQNNRNTRLYRTGDLCRFLEDGNVDYVGRIDHQVKIRGYRIELGEIQSLLLDHPHVHEAIVVAPQNEFGESRLVAYYVLRESDAVSPEELRHYLQDQLPTYMIPSFFVPLGAMPLTPSGKIDRKSLPQPEQSSGHRKITLPKTQMEKEIIQIWEEILHITPIGITDHFFNLGGDSLRATSVIARLKQLKNCQIPYEYFFKNPTVESLAHYIEQSTEQTGIPLSVFSRENPIPLSYAQRSLLMDIVFVPNLVYVFQLKGNLDVQVLEDSLNQLIQRHEALRAALLVDNQGGMFQEIQNPPPLKISFPTGSLDELISIEQNYKFDLTQSPLCRFQLVKESEDTSILLFTVHHLFFDLESLTIFFKELSILYNAQIQGLVPHLPEIPIQWADYTQWLEKDLTPEKKLSYQGYWLEKLKDPPSELLTPTNYPRRAKTIQQVVRGIRLVEGLSRILRPFLKPGTLSRFLLKRDYQGKQYSFTISQDIVRELRKCCEDQGVTLFMILLAAYGRLLQKHSKQRDIIIGSPFSNRTHIELEKPIGFFVNFLPFRFKMKEESSAADYLQEVKEEVLQAFDHHVVPWDSLLEDFKRQESPILMNVGRAMFSLEKSFENSLCLEGIQAKRLPFNNPLCDCELTLIVEEKGNDFRAFFRYRSHLFKEETIQRLSRDFQDILKDLLSG